MEKEKYEKSFFDWAQFLKVLWAKLWIVVSVSLLTAAIGFGIAGFLIQPTYSSSVTLYVNNSNKQSSDSVNASDLTASKSLVETYCEILNNRTTLEMVIAQADLPYTAKELSKMISSGSANGTEVMKVTVTGTDPEEAAKIANCIADILPIRISEIISGATMRVVDNAVPNYQKVAPSVATYTLAGFLLGAVASVLVFAVLFWKDDKIHNEEYILQNYQYPILAKIPDLLDKSTHYGYNYYHYAKAKKTDEKGAQKD